MAAVAKIEPSVCIQRFDSPRFPSSRPRCLSSPWKPTRARTLGFLQVQAPCPIVPNKRPWTEQWSTHPHHRRSTRPPSEPLLVAGAPTRHAGSLAPSHAEARAAVPAAPELLVPAGGHAPRRRTRPPPELPAPTEDAPLAGGRAPRRSNRPARRPCPRGGAPAPRRGSLPWRPAIDVSPICTLHI